MPRKSFKDILQEIGFDVEREFAILWKEFYGAIEDQFPRAIYMRTSSRIRQDHSLAYLCQDNFAIFPTSIRKTYRNLFDYDSACNITFASLSSWKLPIPDFDTYLLLCEYIATMLKGLRSTNVLPASDISLLVSPSIQQVYDSLSGCGYTMIEQDCVCQAVPNDIGAIEAAKSVDKALCTDIMRYGHRSLKGNIDGKRAVLNSVCHHLEAKRDVLTSLSPRIACALFNIANQLDVRHNNMAPESPKYKPFAGSLTEGQLEHWYDNLYVLHQYWH